MLILRYKPIVEYDAATGIGGEINETLIELTGSSAYVFMTVYPVGTFDFVSTSDYEALGKQIARYMAAPYNRQVFLRFAPEMNGNWYDYGVQPTTYVDNWKTMYTTVKAAAPGVTIVWSPYASEGYPWGMVLGNIQSEDTRQILDTDHNNILNSKDDAFKDYYPGDQYVDWNGISYYYNGKQSPYLKNEDPPTGLLAGGVTGTSVITPNGLPLTFTNFYQNYCANKPCMLSETGAAWHSNLTGSNTGTATQSSLQTAWWTDGILNPTFYTTYPKFKMINLAERQVAKEPNYDNRDYRISADDTIRASFLSAFAAVKDTHFDLAVAQTTPTDFSGSNPSLNGVSGALATASTTTSTYVWPSQTKDASVFGAASSLTIGWAWFATISVVLAGSAF
ncbi:glycoside hydrolase family 26 protein [Atractiella rhizophila]|nr:glycoside hydrolase family 26 protein [Atractiella rhizophila]